MAKQKKHARGIRRRADGSYQVHKMIAGARVWQKFPAGTPESVMVKWREDQTAKPAALEGAPAAGSFAADIVAYGRLRAAAPSIGKLIGILGYWSAALGRDRARDTITDTEIQIQAQAWLARGLAPATVRKRIYTLQAFFRQLNGDAGYTPTRTVKKPKQTKYGEPRALAYETIEQILGQMDLVNRYSRNSAAPSWSAYRLRVLAYTGLPPGVLGKLAAIDVELAAAIVHLPARLKGDEVEARSIPLTAQGVAAFRAFAAIGAWGSFNVAGVNRAWRSAARRAGFVDAHGKVSTHVYDLRHSFGTMLYRETRDLATVGRFLGHADGSKETLRYALGARRDVARAAAALVSARFAAAIVTEQRRRAGIQVSA